MATTILFLPNSSTAKRKSDILKNDGWSTTTRPKDAVRNTASASAGSTNLTRNEGKRVSGGSHAGDRRSPELVRHATQGLKPSEGIARGRDERRARRELHQGR